MFFFPTTQAVQKAEEEKETAESGSGEECISIVFSCCPCVDVLWNPCEMNLSKKPSLTTLSSPVTGCCGAGGGAGGEGGGEGGGETNSNHLRGRCPREVSGAYRAGEAGWTSSHRSQEVSTGFFFSLCRLQISEVFWYQIHFHASLFRSIWWFYWYHKFKLFRLLFVTKVIFCYGAVKMFFGNISYTSFYCHRRTSLSWPLEGRRSLKQNICHVINLGSYNRESVGN